MKQIKQNNPEIIYTDRKKVYEVDENYAPEIYENSQAKYNTGNKVNDYAENGEDACYIKGCNRTST